MARPGNLHPAVFTVNLVFALMFAFSAAVQLNDPDPLLWILIYGAAAVCCLDILRRRPVPWFSEVTAAAAVAQALLSARSLVGQTVRFSDLFRAMDDKAPGIELARELGGLLLVIAWMAVLVYFRRTRRSDA